MKRVTLTIVGTLSQADTDKISEALTDLSGVVAADVIAMEGKAYAYSGDELSKEVLESAVNQRGFEAKAINEEYI